MQQTLAPPISIALTAETSAVLRQKAKEQKKSLAKLVAAIVEEYVDYIDDEEDKYLSKIADERIDTCTKLISHEEAWK